MIFRGEMNVNNLKIIYDTVNNMINNKDCFYDEEEIEKIKKDKEKILIKI